MTNRAATPVTLHFSTTCQAFFSVLDASQSVVYDAGRHVNCFQITTQRTVQPGETVNYAFQWNQVDDSGQQVPAVYHIRGSIDSREFVPDAFRTISVEP